MKIRDVMKLIEADGWRILKQRGCHRSTSMQANQEKSRLLGTHRRKPRRRRCV